MEQRLTKYDDHDLTFHLQLYRDYDYATVCLKQLRKIYPASRVIMISDGDDDPRFPELAARHQAEYTAGERLYPIENGGKMVQRMLDAFLARPSKYLFKIDTDTRVHRRFRYLPQGRCIFGTLEHETLRGQFKLGYPNVQGGCVGFTLETARAITESGLLLSDNLLDYRCTYADNPDTVYRAEQKGIISTDFVTRYACMQLGIDSIAFDEVFSLYRGDVPLNGKGFAVTHPHKHTVDYTPWNHFKQTVRQNVKRARLIFDLYRPMRRES